MRIVVTKIAGNADAPAQGDPNTGSGTPLTIDRTDIRIDSTAYTIDQTEQPEAV